ncbi:MULTISPECIES: TOBE domain-containing protein [Rhodopseudomonas]|uniref:Molybdenum-pterin-binding protein n=1 Tax=Rhodopseudomonas palustris TaxID=1076 RepID=A0A0D7EG67_RHOPL|nr:MULTISPECIES: TOBE domain-containing protein [Rhodopseudomonas]KIZ39666.1 molybdenum-pterin-binding protein [Rhodopseudomonas palustris]MDF3810638.1 TOBE domain-containing protein [Rhodopseudomonas sp. BAL398]WOK16022.1 TOBE domain-containing protein [Rhodopseudomonas sp. BAL398]
MTQQTLPIEATVTLGSKDVASVGRERIRLLQAVAREGSITAGAKAVGLSYKAAWDGLDAMTNLFGQPLLETRTGGSKGGGAALTPTGLRVIEAFGRLEAEMARVFRSLEPDLAGSGISPFNLVSGFFMKTSARNALRGTVTAIQSDTLSAEVAVAVSDDTTIYAMLTSESVRSLGLCVGREAIVLIKAPFVLISPGDVVPLVSARNCVRGVVRRADISAVNAEIVLDIGGDKTLAASITARSAADLKLSPGDPACALFDAAHVIVAID